MPRIGWDGRFYACQEPAVGIKRDRLSRPVETVFVKALLRRERELLHHEATGLGGVEAGEHGFGGLKNKVDWMGGVAILMREEFQVDFLGVVPVLFGIFCSAS